MAELNVTLDLLVFPLNVCRRGVQYLLAWENPEFTVSAYVFLMAFLWRGLLPYMIQLAPWIAAAVLAILGLLPREQRSSLLASMARPRATRARTLLERLAALPPDVVKRPLGALPMRGKSQAIELFALEAEREAARAPERGPQLVTRSS